MSSHQENEATEILREARWFEEQQKILALSERTPEQLAPALDDEPGVCTCIDEGTPSDIRLAGSGILNPGGVESVAKILQQADVTEVTSHDHCGAAGIAYRREHGLAADAPVDQTSIDQFAASWSRALAEKMGVEYRHIPSPELQRPVEFHDASVVYVDTIGGFQPQRVAELPKGFVISAARQPASEAISESTLAASIALGDHGYGQKFTSDQPLRIVIVGEADPNLGQELEKIVAISAGRMRLEKLAMSRDTSPNMTEK